MLGVGAGLAFGWLILPAKAPLQATLPQLRADFKADLVLMTAEKFAKDGDATAALNQLAAIDAGDPLTLLANAQTYAQGIGYSQPDLALLQALSDELDPAVYQSWKNGGSGNGK